MTTERHDDWLLTASGVAFYPSDPRAEDVRLSDIGHGLSLLCRFAGQCREFYSVAQHSVLVADIAVSLARAYGPRTEVIEAYALLHDAAEAYVVDLPRPVKLAVGKPYTDIEDRVQTAILSRVGLPALRGGESASAASEIVHRADMIALATELRDLMPANPLFGGTENVEPWPERIVPWTPMLARVAFTERVADALRALGLPKVRRGR